MKVKPSKKGPFTFVLNWPVWTSNGRPLHGRFCVSVGPAVIHRVGFRNRNQEHWTGVGAKLVKIPQTYYSLMDFLYVPLSLYEMKLSSPRTTAKLKRLQAYLYVQVYVCNFATTRIFTAPIASKWYVESYYVINVAVAWQRLIAWL